MKLQIKSISGAVLFEGEAESIKELLVGAVKNKANLRYSNLSGSNLSDSNLRYSNLSDSNLSGSDLRYSNLSGSDLSGSNLSDSNLSGSDLSGSDLRYSNLSGSNLSDSNLSGSNLSGSNLRGSDLSYSNLSGAKNIPSLATAQTNICSEGVLRVYKKCAEGVVILEIPAEAKRSNSTGRKCRAEFAKVLETPNSQPAHSSHDSTFTYKVGEIVRCDKWDDDRWNECSGGIHFFLTREEAESY